MTIDKNAPVTRGYLAIFAEGIGKEIRAAIDKATQPLLDRIAALEAQPSLKYCGVFEESREYITHEVCTHAGSMWVCLRPTKSRPGTSDSWQLAVKAGRDAKQ